MASTLSVSPVSPAALWTGRILSAVVALFLLFAAITDLVKPAFAVQGTIKYGYPLASMTGIGIALLVGVLLYLFPRTSVLGAIVLTGYLGGAVSTHVRAGDPPGLMCFPVLFAIAMWGGLYLRDLRLRALVPLRGDGI